MKILILIAYLIVGIVISLNELLKLKKYKEKYPTYPEEFTLLRFVMTTILWPFILLANTKL
jgi:hypothetical protein